MTATCECVAQLALLPSTCTTLGWTSLTADSEMMYNVGMLRALAPATTLPVVVVLWLTGIILGGAIRGPTIRAFSTVPTK